MLKKSNTNSTGFTFRFCLVVLLQLLVLSPVFVLADDSSVGSMAGKIQSITVSNGLKDVVVVDGSKLSVSDNTVLLDDHGKRISLEAFKNGYSVWCSYYVDEGGGPYVLKQMRILSKYSNYEIPTL